MYSQFKLINANLQEVNPSFLSFFQLQSRVIYVENSGCREFNCKLTSEGGLLKLCCLCQDSLLIVMWPWWQVWTLNWEEIMRLCLHIFKLDGSSGGPRMGSCVELDIWRIHFAQMLASNLSPQLTLKNPIQYAICNTKYTISDIPNTQSQLQIHHRKYQIHNPR